jgi:SNF2 family DNA or RNA helicase
MLNFRKLKQDYSANLLKDGRNLYEKGMVLSAKIVTLDVQRVRLSCRVQGSFDNTYNCEIEINRRESSTIDSDCDCPHKYDCQHLSAVLFYLEKHLDEIIVNYSKETDLGKNHGIDEAEKETLRETFKEAETKEKVRRNKKHEKELLIEYVGASTVLGTSPFFLAEEELVQDRAELAIIFSNVAPPVQLPYVEIQLALRLPYRSKPLIIANIKEFFECIGYQEPFYIGNKRYYFTLQSFDDESSETLKMLMDFARFPEAKDKEERNQRIALIDLEAFGNILAQAFDAAAAKPKALNASSDDPELQALPCFYCGNLEEPLNYSSHPAKLCFELEYIEAASPKILINPTIILDNTQRVILPESRLLECAKPGLIYQNVYHRFQLRIRRKHLRNLSEIRDVTIPEPLFGTLVENSLNELMRYAEVSNREGIETVVTLPYVGKLGAICDINYLNGELEAALHFVYDDIVVPAAPSQVGPENILPFVTGQGILARNLTEEQKILRELFQDFIYDPVNGFFTAKTDKKIIEFMTDTIPRNQDSIKFNCPENLLDQFIYDDTKFKIHLKESDRVDQYEAHIKVDGHLNGFSHDLLWECLSTKRAFVELARKKTAKKKESSAKSHKILVLELDKLAPIIQLLDEMGIKQVGDHVQLCPLWSLSSIEIAQYKGTSLEITMSEKLKQLQKQMLGMAEPGKSPIPKVIKANLRGYQNEGVAWLNRLRDMHLSGILADDMGLGKTLQAIIAITQNKIDHPKNISIVVCPTSLVYNWKEEISKFNPQLNVLAVDGTPNQRKKLLTSIKGFDVVITSYSLLQKDVEFYTTINFGYCILDEAQHIKNRGTRNAKSVKMIQAAHRLILTGTPIENSLDELWSLFDFLMPGLLSSYERFVEKYIRNPSQPSGPQLEILRRKVSPFILRRMKQDVLSELPPVSEIIYHCHLSETQRQLYHSYAESAREELSKLVKREGFEKVQIHVLATLTRLKQICCHPAIFAKDQPEAGDSAKYEMLMELLQNLMEGKHKTVVFSQYTRMLNIIREDLQRQGIPFEYLDGTSKNRLNIVKKFNEDQDIPVFLVSLKAGGTGLNLVGADTVIHYDMWWNPAVENQATDRVHRIGQKSAVSAFKLVTLNTIEEKIMDLQNRKKGLVKKVVSSDEEAIAKLTWEEVLELLQT